MKLHRKLSRKSQPRCVVILVNDEWAKVVKQAQHLTSPKVQRQRISKIKRKKTQH